MIGNDFLQSAYPTTPITLRKCFLFITFLSCWMGFHPPPSLAPRCLSYSLLALVWMPRRPGLPCPNSLARVALFLLLAILAEGLLRHTLRKTQKSDSILRVGHASFEASNFWKWFPLGRGNGHQAPSLYWVWPGNDPGLYDLYGLWIMCSMEPCNLAPFAGPSHYPPHQRFDNIKHWDH